VLINMKKFNGTMPRKHIGKSRKPAVVQLDLPTPPIEQYVSDNNLKWYAGYMRSGLLRLNAGDQVYVREFQATLKMVGKCWWVMSTQRSIMYLVAETCGGQAMNGMIRFVLDAKNQRMTSPSNQVHILNGYFDSLRSRSPTSLSPITQTLTK